MTSPSGAAADRHRRRFRDAIARAVDEMGGDRAAEARSGVFKSVWYDAKNGSIPGEKNWDLMRRALRDLPPSATGVDDWDALYEKVRRRPASAPARPRPPKPSRVHLHGMETTDAFVLPAVSRLGLVDAELDGDDRVVFLVGEGGLGKSVLLGQIAERLGTAERTEAVVLVPCALIPAAADLTTADSADRALAAAAALPGPGLRRFVQELRAAFGEVFLLVDTLDVALSDATADALTTVLEDAAEHARLFVTCRTREFEDLLQDPHSYRPRLRLRLGKAVALPRLGTTEILAWAERYVSGLDRTAHERERFLRSLSDAVSAATVREVCAVPLRLALACELYSETGTVPSDLTITGLYLAYWNRRIARDRQGRHSAQARRQEAAALALAQAVLDQSTGRLSPTVDIAELPDDSGLRALLSEGALRHRAGRCEFFHQTYAEFVIARLLAQRGKPAQLDDLRAGLADPHSFLWSIARHLLLQGSAPDRRDELRDAVPRLTAEGARIHLLAALAWDSPEDLRTLADALAQDDPALLHSLVPLLAQAPAGCREEALRISVPLLEHTAADLLPEATRTVGSLLARLDGPLRRHYLSWALALVDARRDGLSNNLWVGLPENLIAELCASEPGPEIEEHLHGRYAALGVCAQRTMLRGKLAVLRRGEPAAWNGLETAMLAAELPTDLANDDAVDLLRHCWHTPAVRSARGWASWPDLLQDDLPARWDKAQIRLVAEFTRDPDVRRDLLGTVLSDRSVRFRERWVNVARFIADDRPDEVAADLLELPEDAGAEAVGTAAALAKQIAGRLGRARRERLLGALSRHRSRFERQVWPVLVKLANPDADLHRSLLADLAAHDRKRRTAADGPRAVKDWEVVLASTVRTWLNTAPTGFLVEARTDLRALLPTESGGKSVQRRAQFEGRIARHDAGARAWLAPRILDGASPAVAGTAVNTVQSWALEDGEPLSPDVTRWLLALLPTRHTDAAGKIALILADERLVPDASLTRAEWDGIGDAARARLERAVDARENTQLPADLLKLLVELDRRRPLPLDDVRAVMDKLTEPLRAVPARIAADSTTRATARLTSELSLWVDAVNALGLHRLPVAEIERAVGGVLPGWDVQQVSSGFGEALADMLRGVIARSDTFAGRLTEELWTSVGPGTKGAIAEAIAVHERNVPGGRALDLARRSDCPPAVAAKIHERLKGR
ncbi:hypothetical protein [Actinomadura sp.]|uniref:hypothetical protein n=1 Tax=Actinomadura sp. TaxID=1989 RepID=UPI0037C522DA